MRVQQKSGHWPRLPRLELLRERSRATGIWATLKYFSGAILLPRIGIQLKYLYVCDRVGPAPPSQFETCLITSMEQFTQKDCSHLLDFEGETLLEGFRNAFDSAAVCCIARDPAGNLAGVAWLAPAPAHLQTDHTDAFLVRDCFTIPSMRGRGAYPQLLHFACAVARGRALSSQFRVYVSSVWGNESSMRGIHKAGFQHIGLIVAIGKFRRACWRTRRRWVTTAY